MDGQEPCNKVALFGSLFCDKHQGCAGAPINGYEPPFEPDTWNDDESIYKSMNCYAYAFNFRNPDLIAQCKAGGNKECRKYFPQPGALHGDRDALNAEERRSCPIVSDLMMKDVHGIERRD